VRGASGGRSATAKALGKAVACWTGQREEVVRLGCSAEEEGGQGGLLV
jgi:DNA-nicking Smr family endonuclease